MFSIPKPLPEPPSPTLHIGDHKSSTMTRHYPQHQSITSPVASRGQGDWGFKRPFPLKSTMATSTPLIRIKQVDTIENVTDFASAADHTLSLEKFQELRVALSLPRGKKSGPDDNHSAPSIWSKSVFEEDMDYTDPHSGGDGTTKWKFKGPWLAAMNEGDFHRYIKKIVYPKRAKFRELLREEMAATTTLQLNQEAMEKGEMPPPKVEPHEITDEALNEYVGLMRHNRPKLYYLVSKFLDLAPLEPPSFDRQVLNKIKADAHPSIYCSTGPPASHPSAGISYLRTNSYMENHPIYGPQERRTPVLARVLYPRVKIFQAKLGVGGFVADIPAGDNHFNGRYLNDKQSNAKVLGGIAYLDTTTYGGAKAYVEPVTATVDPSGRVILEFRDTKPEAQLIAKEAKGHSKIYHTARTIGYIPPQKPTHHERYISPQQPAQQEVSGSGKSRFAQSPSESLPQE
ncbi:hypothetical protein E4U55_006031 [Claviceps digitariae]|nr:hypothetical protein E4U55_006031 [Claviceps digitariae]